MDEGGGGDSRRRAGRKWSRMVENGRKWVRQVVLKCGGNLLLPYVYACRFLQNINKKKKKNRNCHKKKKRVEAITASATTTIVNEQNGVV